LQQLSLNDQIEKGFDNLKGGDLCYYHIKESNDSVTTKLLDIKRMDSATYNFKNRNVE